MQPTSKHTVLHAVLAVVIVLIIGGVFVFRNKLVSIVPGPASTSTPASHAVLKHEITAPTGTKVAGFPSELIVSKDAVIVKSDLYSTTGSGGSAKQILTLSYTSKSTMSDISSSFASFAKAKNYTIVQGTSKTDTNAFTIAASPDLYIVLIKDEGTMRQVNITVDKQ